MIEERQMTIEDFLHVMDSNKDQYPQFAALTEEQRRFLAWLNCTAGVANTYIEDGIIVGVGGVRYIGVGEAWMLTPPTIRDDRKFSLLRHTKKSFKEICSKCNLWRVFATSEISESFLRHLGFKATEKPFVFTDDKYGTHGIK